jgi:hypothetical protein
MKTPKEIVKIIENMTGLKIGYKINKLDSSLRGYITFTAKKQKDIYPNWSYENSCELISLFATPEPNPVFCSNNNTLCVYFGNEAYNF